MDALTRRRALSAAAKVAFSFTFIGAGTAVTACGAGSLDDRTAGNDDQTDDALHRARDAGKAQAPHACNGAADAAADAPVDASTGPVCALPAGGDAGPSDEAITCCVDLVGSRAAADGGSDPSIAACCQAIGADYWKGNGFENQKETTALWACCGFGDIPQSTCSPWGPPMPPRMRGAKARARSRRRGRAARPATCVALGVA